MRREPVVELESRYGRRGSEVLARLRAVKAERGRITAADVDAVAAEVGLPRAHVYGAASFYADLGFEPQAERHVRVCDGTACLAATGGGHAAEAESELGGEASTQRVYCLGYCYGGPAALDGETPCAGPDLTGQLGGRSERRDPPIPFASCVDDPVVLAGLCGGGPDGWRVWRELTVERGGARVLREVLESGLRGRGGAGFPAARKWELLHGHLAPRHVICNGDEGDPGSYIDRLLMEQDPHRVLAGLALAGLACGAEHGWVYVRSEYPRAREALRAAVAEARAAGDLGRDVHGTGIDFDVEVFEGAGSYVAGEETSLIHSIDGLRGSASSRPPFPTDSGVYARPTAVNNVETLAAVPWILDRGGTAFHRHGVGESRGTKLVCLNERFERPGVYEVDLGVTLRHLCEEVGGGLRGGRPLRSLQVGGPLGGFLGPDQLDTPLTFEDLAAAGAALGHGSLVAFDDTVPGAAVLRHTWRFAADESCGACSPCRVGSRRGLELADLVARGDAAARARQERLAATMSAASLCAFGGSIAAPVRGIMRTYADELGDGR